MHGTTGWWYNNYITRHQIFRADRVEDSCSSAYIDDITTAHRVAQVSLVLRNGK